jgi:uncharacterized membrane protein
MESYSGNPEYSGQTEGRMANIKEGIKRIVWVLSIAVFLTWTIAVIVAGQFIFPSLLQGMAAGGIAFVAIWVLYFLGKFIVAFISAGFKKKE